jgi:hypothetical protein
MSVIHATPFAQIFADDDEEAYTEAIARARYVEGQRGQVIWAFTVSYSRQCARCHESRSQARRHERAPSTWSMSDLALAESYRDNHR